MSGNARLQNLESVAQVTDAKLAFEEQVEDSQSARFRECPERHVAASECHIHLGAYVNDRARGNKWGKLPTRVDQGAGKRLQPGRTSLRKIAGQLGYSFSVVSRVIVFRSSYRD